MKLLTEYFKLQKKIYDYFSYQEDWKVIPLDDQTDCYWMLFEDSYGGKCVWSDEPFTKESIEAGADIYSGEIYTQRHLPKWVYRGESYIMIAIDTQTDGNKFLMIFSNELEEKSQEMKELYEQYW